MVAWLDFVQVGMSLVWLGLVGFVFWVEWFGVEVVVLVNGFSGVCTWSMLLGNPENPRF